MALPVECQRLYLFLLSQGNLTHLGILPLTLRRWAQSAPGLSVVKLRGDLDRLDAAGFVVVDDDTEELLIRTLLRGDGVYKQPNVLRGAVNTAPAVQSARIKRGLLREIDRIDLTEVPEDKGRRDAAAGLLDELREALATPSPNPFDEASGTLTGTHSEGVSEPIAEGFGDLSTHARAQPLVLSPAPTPSVKPPSSTASAADAFGSFWIVYPRKVGKQAARKAWTKALRTTTADVILAAVVAYRDDPNQPDDRTLIPHPSTWLNEGRWDDEPLPPRLAPSKPWSRIPKGQEHLPEHERFIAVNQ